MSINAPVSDYDGKWFIEDGRLIFHCGGDFDGEIVVSGGQLQLDDPYTFRTLTFRLGNETNSRPYINDLSRLAGGAFRIDAAGAAEGTYLLADGADGFDGTVAILDASGESAAALAVGGTVRAGDSDYALELSGGRLSLTVRKSAVR